MGNIYHTVDENASFLAVFFTAFFSLLNSSRSETEAIHIFCGGSAHALGSPSIPVERHRALKSGTVRSRLWTAVLILMPNIQYLPPECVFNVTIIGKDQLELTTLARV
jgi:hypothetical protein